MKSEYEELQSKVKRRFSFRYNPEYTEMFETTIERDEIIPLAIEVCEKLEWSIVYADENSVEAKRKGSWNKLTEKITVTKNAFGRIDVHSKTIEGHFADFGANSKRTGLFKLVFEKLAKEYQKSGILKELKENHRKEINWENYEVPETLPPPKMFSKASISHPILSAIIIAMFAGLLIGFLTVKFTYLLGLYELGLGFGMGYFLGQSLISSNYVEDKPIKIILFLMMLLMFCTNLLTQYFIVTTENSLSHFSFYEFLLAILDNGLNIDNTNLGWIGLVASWIFQIGFSYFIALLKVSNMLMKFMIQKIPPTVIDYAGYLMFIKEKPEEEVREELSKKGWSEKNDQDDVFSALGTIIGLKQSLRE